MAEDSKNILREMFVKIGLIGEKDSKRKLGFFKKTLQSLVGDIKTFQANLAALAVSNAFGVLNRGAQALLGSIKGLIVESSNLAAVQEDAENRLRSALEVAGDFSQEEFDGLKAFAGELQNISTVGDEVILQGLTLTKAFGATNEQAKELTEAALNVASATGKNFNEAVAQVAKTLGGFAGELGEVNPAIKALTAEELKAGKAAEVLNQQFGGIAQRNLRSFSAQWTQLKNIIGDTFEAIGDPINQALLPIIRALKVEVVALQPAFRKMGEAIGVVIQVAERLFKDIFSDTNFNDLIGKFGQFIIDLALLVEDFFLLLSGKPSFLGQRLGIEEGGSIGENLAAFIASVAEPAAKAVASVIVAIVSATFGVLFDKIGEVVNRRAENFKKNVSSIGTGFSAGAKAFKDAIAKSREQSLVGQLIRGEEKVNVASNVVPFPSSNNTTNNNQQQSSVTNNNITQNNTINTTQAGNAAVKEIDQTVKQLEREGSR